MIRSKAKLHKSIPLFFLLASAASLAAASGLPEKRGFREEIQQMAQNVQAAANTGAAQAVGARSDRPERNADRGRDGDRDGRRGGHSRGNDGRGGRRQDADRGRGQGGRDNRRYDNDRNRSQQGGSVHRDRDRNNGRRDDRWQADRNRGSWGNEGRRDRYENNSRHDRYDNRRHDRYDRRWDDHRGGSGYRHHSWDHGYRGRRAWHDSYLRNGFYYRVGRFIDLAFTVPSFLTIDYDPRYDEYYYGSVFHPGYGRDFEVFLFPTYYHDRVEYIPYAYADGRLYGRGRMLPGSGGVSIRFDF